MMVSSKKVNKLAFCCSGAGRHESAGCKVTIHSVRLVQNCIGNGIYILLKDSMPAWDR